MGRPAISLWGCARMTQKSYKGGGLIADLPVPQIAAPTAGGAAI